jgi:hypothetical protein
MTMDEIRQTGLDALAERLGPYGTVQFLRQFERGKGDYTRDRDQWLPKDMDTIIAGVKRLQEEERK